MTSLFKHTIQEKDYDTIDISNHGIDPHIPQSELLSLFFHTKDTEITKPELINDNDRTQRRYFLDTLVCYECGESGHINKKCPTRIHDICMLCAGRGHKKSECPMMVCNKCYNCGHQSRMCPVNTKSRFIMCKNCPTDHSVRDCPTWREYRVNNMKIDTNVKKSCCICFGEHFVDDCKRNRSRVSIFNSDFMKIVKLYKR